MPDDGLDQQHSYSDKFVPMTASTAQAGYLVGVDLAGARFAAGTFTPSFQLLGKAQFSPKPERGAQTVVDRLARCIRDAVDECDLVLSDIRAVGLAVPGDVNAAAGRVLTAPSLGWNDLDLRQQLEQRLQRPVALDNDCASAALAVHRLECPGHSGRLAAVFPDRAGLVGLVVNGAPALLPPSIASVRCRLGSDLLPLTQSPKPLRKALQAGEPRAQQIVADLTRHLASWIEALVPILEPDLVVFSGGLIEELHAWLWPAIQAEVAPRLGGRSIGLKLSTLGKNVAMIGGAVVAAGT